MQRCQDANGTQPLNGDCKMMNRETWLNLMVEALRGQDVPEWSERLADTLKQMDEQEEGEAEA